MNTKNTTVDQDLHIKNLIEKTLNSTSIINEVKVPPFFKEQTLNALFTEKESEHTSVISWYTPKFQLATLALLITLNIMAFTQIKASSYNKNINTLSDNLGLTSISIENSLFE